MLRQFESCVLCECRLCDVQFESGSSCSSCFVCLRFAAGTFKLQHSRTIDHDLDVSASSNYPFDGRYPGTSCIAAGTGMVPKSDILCRIGVYLVLFGATLN